MVTIILLIRFREKKNIKKKQRNIIVKRYEDAKR